MKLIENKNNTKSFFLYKGEEVFVFEDEIKIGGNTLPAKKQDVYQIENDVLFKKEKCKGSVFPSYFRFDGYKFEPENFRYKLKEYFNFHWKCSYEFSNGFSRISLSNDEDESVFEFPSDAKYKPIYFDNKEILLLCHVVGKSLLFYPKTGERLWEYKVEEGREIHESGVMVVDDIVVIPSKENGQAVLVEGYNLLTGEKLWEVDDKDCCNYCYSIDRNKMLYSLASFYCKDHTVELRLTQINPFTGEAEMSVLKEGDYWGQIRSLNETIYGNKLFYVNLNKAEGFSLGVVDLDSKELIEDMPLESDGFHVEKPIVTDDKIYVLILHDDKGLNELRIYENEFK